jgi:hypothetical protein
LISVSGAWRWQNDLEGSGNAYFTSLSGTIGNYQPGYTISLLVNGIQLPGITVNPDSTFSLTDLINYPFPFAKTNIPLQITFTDSLGNKNWIDTTIAIDNLTSNPSIETAAIKIYPNPVNRELTVTNLQPHSQLTLYMLDGRKALTPTHQTGSTVILNTANLPKGIYLLHIVTPTGVVHQMKVVKE